MLSAADLIGTLTITNVRAVAHSGLIQQQIDHNFLSFVKRKKNISKYCLLKNMPRVLNIKGYSVY